MKQKPKRRRLKKKYRRFLQILCLVLLLTFFIHKKNQSIKTRTHEDPTTEVKPSLVNTQTNKFVQAVVDTSKLNEATAQQSDYLVNVYQEAATNSKIVDAVFHGGWATYLESEGNFYKIQTDAKVTGYIAKNQANLKKHTQKKAIKKLSDLTVVLDAGHGGEDVGSLDNSKTIYEKDLTLKTAKTVQETLEKKGINVIMTRKKNNEYVRLNNVADIANNKNTDLFISFHYDNYDYANQASGFTTYYLYEKSKSFAETINNQLIQTSPLQSRGVQEGNFLVLRKSYPISILLELGFMNNDQDLATMNTANYRQMVAKNLLKGIETYYNLSKE